MIIPDAVAQDESTQMMSMQFLSICLQSLKGTYKDTKTRTEATIVRWQWATNREQSLREAAQAGSTIDLRSLCNRVATRLNHLDFLPIRMTKEFIVYAVDDDLADLEENLAAARVAKNSRGD